MILATKRIGGKSKYPLLNTTILIPLQPYLGKNPNSRVSRLRAD
jgi:hypothetical protein